MAKKLIKRAAPDRSQHLRWAFQGAFFLLNVWIGVQFYLWVRWAESGGQTLAVSRPAGVEGWLPIQGLMQLRYFLGSGRVPGMHAASFFLFVALARRLHRARKSCDNFRASSPDKTSSRARKLRRDSRDRALKSCSISTISRHSF